MRILVAGGQGQVGSALAQLGLEQNLDLVALGRQDLDITSADSVSFVFAKYQPDLLINAAAYTAVEDAENEPELAFAINEKAIALLAEACVQRGIPMLHISTDYVFDGLKDGAYVETDPVNPMSVYAKSKEAGERLLRERLDKHIILRTSWVFGVQGNNFVRTVVRMAKVRDRLEIVDDQCGGPTSARAIAHVLLEIASQLNVHRTVAWGTYHFSQKPYVSRYQFALAIVEQARNSCLIDHPVDTIPISSRDFSTSVMRPGNSRLESKLLEINFKIKASSWLNDLCELLNVE